ncbi:MAG: glutamine--fructose-6-phosphate transaminase (isomerizing) [Lachnospiraceae bacterium]|nr:glutamine--fructose-6-phosphate transaminase (isomerizing) [Lachnospiraceae bacterium]
MCGIVGYTGGQQAAPVLLSGLTRLEYRGYDSAGLAVRNGEADTVVVKAEGKLKNLSEKVDGGHALKGLCGIGHTRWATHGAANERNAHPHASADHNVIAVHNGIIENYVEIKEKLTHKGYEFSSDTDTEAVVNLIDYYYKKYKVGPIDAIAKTLVRVRGSYALAIMFKEYPGEIYVARKDSPMIIGTTGDETFVASDVPAILNYTRQVYYIGNLEMARLTPGHAEFYDLNGDIIEKPLTKIEWNAEAAEKQGYEHFMIKEIHEQPKAIEDTMKAYVKMGDDGLSTIDFSEAGLTKEILADVSQIHIVACGSASHVGYVAQYVIEDLARIPVRVEMASEFRYRKPILDPKGLVVVISQSGETADTLEGLREAKAQGIRTVAIVNVKGSSIAREADHVVYTYAGPEIAVATTKAYSCQLIASYLLAITCAETKGRLDAGQVSDLLMEMGTIPGKIQTILEDKERVQRFATGFAAMHDAFFIGRSIDYAICMEGSLKLKEVSYIHSEAYAAGELKHGTISLVEEGTLMIGVLTQSNVYEKTLSNMQEVKSRGGFLMGLTTAGNYTVEDTADVTFYVPKTDEHFAASLAVVPLQLLGYYSAVARGEDVDKPRNLAKSVTVE